MQSSGLHPTPQPRERELEDSLPHPFISESLCPSFQRLGPMPGTGGTHDTDTPSRKEVHTQTIKVLCQHEVL